MPWVVSPGGRTRIRAGTATGLIVTGDQTIHEMEHGPDLAGRAAGDVEKGQQLSRRAALEAFGDVVGYFRVPRDVSDSINLPDRQTPGLS